MAERNRSVAGRMHDDVMAPMGKGQQAVSAKLIREMTRPRHVQYLIRLTSFLESDCRRETVNVEVHSSLYHIEENES